MTRRPLKGLIAMTTLCFSFLLAEVGTAAQDQHEVQENLFWQSIVDSTNPADFEAYLQQFPNGVFRVLARNRLEVLGPAQE